MEKILKLYTYVDGGVNDTPFPSDDGQIEIPSFRYDAKRMGGAPIITATVYNTTCLDSLWTDAVYASFGGERYFLKQTPTSAYDSSDFRYRHDVELLSERAILNDVYFLDVVSEMDGDEMVSNGSEFSFFGDINEFARRLALSLSYSNVGYSVVVDEGVTSESSLFSFSNVFFANAIQESYNQLEIPYYFVGKVIHFGYSSNTIDEVFSYGVDESLVGITRENANFKLVNRATATGSSDNIPFYYPNETPLGDISLETTSQSVSYTIKDSCLLINNLGLDESLEYRGVSVGDEVIYYSENGIDYDSYYDEPITIEYDSSQKIVTKWFKFGFRVYVAGNVDIGGTIFVDDLTQNRLSNHLSYVQVVDGYNNEVKSSISGGIINCGNLDINYYTATIGLQFPIEADTYSIAVSFFTDVENGWYKLPNGNKKYDLSKIGIEVSGIPSSGDTITLKQDRYVKTSPNLLPSKYRETEGKERFYNATNDTYTDGNGNPIVFEFPYFGANPKEHIFSVEDLKPSIKGMTNEDGLRVDMFSEFAYDLDDNDETYDDGEGSTNYKHPYFFAKLRKLDFNLFDHAIEGQAMRFSFTSGDCGACEFEIGVDEETQKNTVQVDENGDLIRDEEGRVLCGVEGSGQGDVDIQPQQNDTINNEVWIALRKEENTYGIIMPSANNNLKPKPCTSATTNDGDTFVILGINLPKSYILYAEEALEKEIIKYLQDNNLEKFNFNINFSRIYFEENPTIADSLSENSRIKVSYNGEVYEQYISSYSYTMSEGEILPQISVELSESLTTSQNAMQNAINEVKATMGREIYHLQEGLMGTQDSFVNKQKDDSAYGKVNFTKGVKFGEGGEVEILENNSAKLKIEYLEVTKKATFNSLEIQEKRHVGGQLLVTNASIIVGEVEEFDDYYRCYFQTKGEEDKQVIFNTFAVNDQAICQTFNAWGTRYYWRLVVGVGEDYIDLSKTDYDMGSMYPMEGDKVIQLGNRNDVARQNAIMIAAYGEESPYIIQYKGINNYTLPETSEDERIMTKLSPRENILTGLVRMTAGSSGLEMFKEWASKQELIDSKVSSEDLDAYKVLVEKDLDEIKKQVDGAITTWFYDPVPTLDNAPANEWTTKELKDLHLGDLYYSGEGKAYRFQYNTSTSTYYWNLIEDEDITLALGNAQKAQDTADGKRRVFVIQPTPPYDEGDLWSRGSTLPMLVCVNAKTSGSFAESDWDYADNNAALSETIAGFDYIKQALKEDTTILGGLIQSSILSLGYTDANGVYHIMSGTNGVYDSSKIGGGIASWWGGEMSEESAKALVRFDGTGYFADGLFKWDASTGVNLGNGKIKINYDGTVEFSEGIKISSDGDETLGSVLTSLSNIGVRVSTVETSLANKLDKSLFDTLFTPHYNTEGELESIEAKVDFWSNGEITALGQGTGGGGGSEGGADLLDVWISLSGNTDTYKDYQVNASHLTAYLTSAKIAETYATKEEIDNINIPTKTSDLENDSGYITIEDVPQGIVTKNYSEIMKMTGEEAGVAASAYSVKEASENLTTNLDTEAISLSDINELFN